MKPNIHPYYGPVRFQDQSTGATIETRSTLAEPGRVKTIVADVTSDSHPAWTGKRTHRDSEGRVAAFERRYGQKS